MTTINDREWAFLAEATGEPGPFNDMYFKYLRGLGYTGTLQDMIAKSGGGLTPSKGVGGNLLRAGQWLMSVAGGTSTATELPPGQLNLTGDGTNQARGDQKFASKSGQLYALTLSVATLTANVAVGTSQGGASLLNTTVTFNTTKTLYFLGTGDDVWVRLGRTGTGGTCVVTGITLYEAEAWEGIKASLATYLATTDGADNPHSLAAMASPPTVTTSTSDLSATYATTLVMATANDFAQCLLEGGAYTLEGSDLRPAQATRASGTEQKNVSRLSFNVVDASAIAFYVIGTTLPYRFLLDDQYVDFTGTVPAATTGTGNNWIILTPGSNFTGKVSIELQQNCKLRRIGLPAGASFGTKPTAKSYRGIVLGDSFTEGGNATHYGDGFVPVLSDYLGIDLWPSGVGSTGYVNTSSGTRYKLSERIAADLDRALLYGELHLVIVAMGYNDIGLSGIQAEAEACYAIIRQKCPGAVVHVLGPWDRNAPSGPATNYDTCKAAIQAAVGSRGGFSFIDMEGVAYTKAADTVHPSTVGHNDLRTDLESEVRALIAA